MKKYLLSVFIILLHFCNYNPLIENEESMGHVRMSIDMNLAPEDVTALAGILSREEFDSVFFDFVIAESKAEALIDNIESGQWELYVKAMNNDGTIIYDGSVMVEVIANVVTLVNLHLDPLSTTGSIKITVTWGELPGKQKILFMAQNSADIWRVLSINLDGSNFQDIIAGSYPFWIDDKEKIYFRSGINIIASYSFNTGNNEDEYYIPLHGNFFRYSSQLNRIIFDYKIDDYKWNIGHFSLSNQEISSVVADGYWNKRPVPLNNSEWIYYQSDLTGKQQIYKVNFDGTQKIPVTNSVTLNSGFPSFNKEGTKMLYSVSGDGEYSLVIRDLNDNTEKLIPFKNEVLYPTYSEDGKFIIYIIVKGPDYKDREMYIMNEDGTLQKPLTTGKDYYHYARPITW